MNSHLIPAMLGSLFLGVILGGWGVIRLQRWMGQFREGRGKCTLCANQGYIFTCERCRRRVAMCHAYHILKPSDPDPAKMRPRPAWDVCTACATEEERAFLEKP